MAKFGFFEDTFEKVLETGISIAKQSGKQIAQTINPLKLAESAMGLQKQGDKTLEQLEKGQSKKQNHTKLDFQKLQKKYTDQDQMKTKMLRQRLFQLVKTQEEKSVTAMRQEEVEKKRKEAYEEEEKKRKAEEKKRDESMSIAPMGKIRRSIFSAKKMAKREQTEVKPASGKQ